MSQTKSKRKIVVLVVIGAAVLLMGAAVPAGWQWHEQPSFCPSCHEMQPYLDSYRSDTMVAGKHAAKGVVCLDCHVPTVKEQLNELVVHVKGAYKTPLKQRDMGDAFCLDCHLEASTHHTRLAVVALTANREAEFVVNPHDPYHEEFECSACHTVHRTEPDNPCISCHVPGVPLDQLPAY